MAWPCCCFVQDLTLYFIYIYLYINTFVSCGFAKFQQGSNWPKKDGTVPFLDEENEIPEHMMIEGFRWSISHLGFFKSTLPKSGLIF